MREVIIEIWVEGSGSQSIGTIHISISDLIQDHLLKSTMDSNAANFGKVIKEQLQSH